MLGLSYVEVSGGDSEQRDMTITFAFPPAYRVVANPFFVTLSALYIIVYFLSISAMAQIEIEIEEELTVAKTPVAQLFDFLYKVGHHALTPSISRMFNCEFSLEDTFLSRACISKRKGPGLTSLRAMELSPLRISNMFTSIFQPRQRRSRG